MTSLAAPGTRKTQRARDATAILFRSARRSGSYQAFSPRSREPLEDRSLMMHTVSHTVAAVSELDCYPDQSPEWAHRSRLLQQDTVDREALFAEFQPLVSRLIRQYAQNADQREDLRGEIYCRFCELLAAYDPA